MAKMSTSKSKYLAQSKRLKWVEPVFNELKTVIDEYVSWEQEPPYWNNENASVSMLVAAGARSNYVVLSDYRTDKTDKGEPVDGRCDLLMGKEDNWLEMEAKPTYVRLENAKNNIERALASAVADANCLNSDKPHTRAGLLFATLSIHVPQELKSTKSFLWSTVREDLAKFETVFAKIDADLCWMWWNEDADKRYRWDNEEWFHPGIAIFLKMCNV